jgi:outer membrane protein assembly factor BamB
MKHILFSLTLATMTSASHSAFAADAALWGNGPGRNMVSDEKNLPDTFDPGKYKQNTEDVDMATTKNIKWAAKLGSQAYGNPTVAGGKIFIGTNNETPRDPKNLGDKGVVMCFDEKTGKFLWQLAIPKLGTGKVSDWEFLGICSPPQVEGNRAYLVTNRCEVLCIDVEGMANGNDGPYKDEGKYLAEKGKPPFETGPQDGDIIWRLDMRDEVGVFPHNITSSAILIVGDKLFVTTSNGQDWSHINIPAPNAPALICVDKNTGALLGEEASGISQKLFHANWSSPSYAEIGGKGQVIFGGGDGFAYGFDPTPVAGPDDFKIFKEIWKYDAVPPSYRMKDGKPIKYPAPEGPSEIISTPVIYKDRAYIAIGQDPEHGDGVGSMSCVDISKTGNITESGKIWTYNKITRTISTPSIINDLVFISDYAGNIHCVDANTGKDYWIHNSGSHIWGSTLVADGKLYVGNEDGDFFVMEAGKEKKILHKAVFPAPVYSTPIAANGTLFVATPTHLYAIAK